MSLNFRRIRIEDIHRLFVVRAATRENPLSQHQLAQMGVTPGALRQGFEQQKLCGWVCLGEGQIIGFCTADLTTGEVLVLALLPDYEGQGIGRQLLNRVVTELKHAGRTSIWLSADSNPSVRAHGFYRRLGWRPTGELLVNGDEILKLAVV